MIRDLVLLAGSPSPTSRSAFVAKAFAREAQQRGLRPRLWSLSDFDPSDVLFARATAPALARFIEEVKAAHALVLSTPVYKASYSGALKAIVDVIPPDALVGRPALGIATGRLPAHGEDVDRSFRALFAFFKARAVGTLFVLDQELPVEAGVGIVSAEIEQRVGSSVHALAAALEEGRPPAPQA
jgi:FMN reductase